MKRGNKAWLALAGGILAYEGYQAAAGPEHLLSSAADDWIAKRPVLARVAIVSVGTILTIHVGNLIPQPTNWDPISMGFWQRLLHS